MTRRLSLSLLAVAVVAAGAVVSRAADKKPVAPALNFTMKDIDGKDVPLRKYQGKVLLVVNVASRCGNTPQYSALQSAYEKYHQQGFAVLGFPANDFGKQEPGTEAEIKEFCTAKYNVSFPMFSKIVVKGDGQAPLYHYLTDKATNPAYGGDIEWNFAKFLINRKGEVVARFPAKMNPSSPEIVEAIEKALAEPAK
jgi:glutathione peroxidase